MIFLEVLKFKQIGFLTPVTSLLLPSINYQEFSAKIKPK